MTERLIIKNFAGIKALQLDIKQVNILIGPQASGKSICAKLLFYFKNFVHQMVNTAIEQEKKRKLDSDYESKFEEYFPPKSWGKGEFKVRYEYGENFIEVSRLSESKGSGCKLSYSENYKKELAAIRRIRSRIQKQYEEYIGKRRYEVQDFQVLFSMRSEMLSHIRNSLGEKSGFSQTFIPAGRSFFANLQSNIFSFLSNNNALDPFMSNFGSVYENIKDIPVKALPREKNEILFSRIEGLVEETLCGQHVQEKGQDFIKMPDGRKIEVKNSSSGQQETLPLVIILSRLPFLNSVVTGGRTTYIEEPEAHLFPHAQKKVIELVATVFNSAPSETQFFITTHSPYVLTALNNLLQAGQLFSSWNNDLHKIHQLENIVPKDQTLRIKDISAYALEGGQCKNILSQETNLIEANVIDQVSDDLALQFDALLELEF